MAIQQQRAATPVVNEQPVIRPLAAAARATPPPLSASPLKPASPLTAPAPATRSPIDVDPRAALAASRMLTMPRVPTAMHRGLGLGLAAKAAPRPMTTMQQMRQTQQNAANASPTALARLRQLQMSRTPA